LQDLLPDREYDELMMPELNEMFQQIFTSIDNANSGGYGSGGSAAPMPLPDL
jgi:hypothetical protein